MQLNFNSSIEATDQERRIIAGKIVPFGEIGNTSVGKVVFEQGSINYQTGGKIKLLLEHSATDPIGFAQNITEDTRGLYATFKVSATTKGTDSLIEASENLRDGLSIGVSVDASEERGGVLYVQSAVLREVSLVQAAAFKSAAVESVAASEVEPEPVEETQETQPTESEASVSENATPATPEVEAAQPVEASRPAVTAVAYAAVRNPIQNKVDYLQHSILAAMGNDNSRQYVIAADNTTSTAPGMVPTPQSTTVINALANADRGMIDALSRETLVGEGMTFELPRVSAVPVVTNIAENGAVAESSLSATYLSVPVQSFKGRAITTIELMDRSNPSYMTALMQNLEFAYAKVTDEFATGTIAGAGQQTGVNANTAAGFLAYGSEAAAAVYGSSLGFAQNLVVSPGQWQNLMGYNVDGRPIYTSLTPQNSGGTVSAQSLRGTVAPGLNLFVSRSIGNAGATTSTGDFSMVVINPDAWTWYESSRFQLRTAIQSDGTIDLLYYGYAAIAPKIPFGACWNQT
jgi:HK97 family phage prohead protease